ncbi:helix-turn-helix domain-containing protein [Pseudomonas tritici]|uniref:helix-turn-helix domain-containing protein n=1 Tax=Pseudomonas tritici TaxID=2745518 RepID=UPI00387B942A
MINVSPLIKEAEGSRLRNAYARMKLTKRITQTDIAAQCGWSNASTFNRLLSGQSALTLESLERLAKILGVEPSAISPRLAQASAGAAEARMASQLPVKIVRAVSRGSWGEPFISLQRFAYFTADPSAFALCFDTGQAPAGLDGWVVIIEPGQAGISGDFVIVRHGIGKYSYGRVSAQNDDGSRAVAVQGRGELLTSPKRCWLVSALCRRAELSDFRACADY